ncbi:MAG: hypothetical protein WDO56_09625 [Gammaproteobacteria bacterium]
MPSALYVSVAAMQVVRLGSEVSMAVSSVQVDRSATAQQKSKIR